MACRSASASSSSQGWGDGGRFPCAQVQDSSALSCASFVFSAMRSARSARLIAEVVGRSSFSLVRLVGVSLGDETSCCLFAYARAASSSLALTRSRRGLGVASASASSVLSSESTTLSGSSNASLSLGSHSRMSSLVAKTGSYSGFLRYRSATAGSWSQILSLCSMENSLSRSMCFGVCSRYLPHLLCSWMSSCACLCCSRKASSLCCSSSISPRDPRLDGRDSFSFSDAALSFSFFTNAILSAAAASNALSSSQRLLVAGTVSTRS